MPTASNELEGPRPPRLDRETQRELAARARTLKPSVQIGARGLTDSIVAQVRQAMAKHELIKVRVRVDTAKEAHRIGEQLAELVPCHLVQCVGKVLVLYASPDLGSP